MYTQAINNYLSSTSKTPYFLALGDEQYKDVRDKLSELGLTSIKVSEYCSGADKLPDIDALLDLLKSSNKLFVVIGLGEYLALRGRKETQDILSRLKDIHIGNKALFLLRGIVSQIKEFQTDPRFDRCCSILDPTDCHVSIILVKASIGINALAGIKKLLMELEAGQCNELVVTTAVNLDNALFTVKKITNAYEGILFISPGFNLPSSCVNDTQWSELLSELTQNNNSLDAVFEKKGFSGSLAADFDARLAGFGWLYFIALKHQADKLTNTYLRFVVKNTDHFDDFKKNILHAIIDVAHKDERFSIFYSERKKLVEKFSEPESANFVISNRKNIEESIYKLTDRTKPEREEIIAWVARYGIIPKIAEIYPALSYYLKKYIFNCGELSDLLTDYFEAYKQQKISNTIEAHFMEKVEQLAISRDYNRLPTRNAIIEGLNKDDTYLYWMDALGVEYLAFILQLAHSHKLSLAVHIARADLPTITSINRDFYDNWPHQKEKNDALDEVKHKAKVGYNFENNALPLHLVKELDIIQELIEYAATKLSQRHYKRFLLVSDHGASRLAVLPRKFYATDTKGEHSGRCCKVFASYDLPFATEENGYLVLADYGRFTGSRAAAVEVHGGASLEEVVVPIIELTLKDSSIRVEIVDEVVTVDFRRGTEIGLFFNASVNNVSIILNGKRYAASLLEGNHYKVALPDIKRAGNYPADVYAGEDLIGKILIKAQGRSGKVNEKFDDLF